jgi:hypothetical protein
LFSRLLKNSKILPKSSLRAKQSRQSMKSMNGWIATPGFALLAMTNAEFLGGC